MNSRVVFVALVVLVIVCATVTSVHCSPTSGRAPYYSYVNPSDPVAKKYFAQAQLEAQKMAAAARMRQASDEASWRRRQTNTSMGGILGR